MLKLLKWVSLLILALAIVIGVIGLIGQRDNTLAQSILSVSSTSKTQACWYDICPSQITLEQSIEKLSTFATSHNANFLKTPTFDYLIYAACIIFQSHKWRICTEASSDAKPQLAISLYLSDSGLRLGDLIALLGEPTDVLMCLDVYERSLLPNHVTNILLVFLGYSNGLQISAYTPVNIDTIPIARDLWALSPTMQIIEVDYGVAHPDMRKFIGDPNTLWHGFDVGRQTQNICGSGN